MGRLVLFLIVVAAALAGVWFYAPGGKDMLLGAKSTVMGMVGKAEPAATEVVVEEVVVEDAAAAAAVVDDEGTGTIGGVDDGGADDGAASEGDPQ